MKLKFQITQSILFLSYMIIFFVPQIFSFTNFSYSVRWIMNLDIRKTENLPYRSFY